MLVALGPLALNVMGTAKAGIGQAETSTSAAQGERRRVRRRVIEWSSSAQRV
jgi:hypothetical protein